MAGSTPAVSTTGNEGSFKMLYLLSHKTFDGDRFRGRNSGNTHPPSKPPQAGGDAVSWDGRTLVVGVNACGC
jgi:hypothetical protein